ncbi:NUDIX hydrolase [Kribbella flavida DSM 17836]|uniref:NUDIX hydrolase n=1 Tax=Kribbella flavida (strain DSM 17836 / JCM 10339 / NBRC 14399) TaxID=479435 RepID=D2PW57_KRIFD|nr:GNAT family N-acetyltransferase [Kribbella flavida]ADB31509.1 NUDIX hydrolase [Kribbella flavida DSM 17836]
MITVREVDPFDRPTYDRWDAAFRAGAAEGRPDALLVTQEALASSLRNRGPRKVRIPVAAFDGDRMVGAMLFEYWLLDNPDTVAVEINVPPAERRRGAGTALWRWASARAAELGRTIFQAELGIPGQPWPGSLFAAGLGFTVENVEDHLVVRLPYDEARRERLRAEAGELTAYRLTSWVGLCPPEHRQAYADLHTAMDRDVPSGGMIRNPAPWTAERIVENEQRTARNYLALVTLAHTLDGTPAGYTLMYLLNGDPEHALQDDTLVLREHRGHNLGTQLKLANLDQLAEQRTTQRLLHTWTAQSNGAMQKINARFGFEPVEVLHELQRVAPKLRPAARALVVDRDDRILLLRFEFADGHRAWAAPGGGVEPGESLREALTRELAEEIGLEAPADAPLVWHQEVVADGHAKGYDGVTNDYFLVRVDSHHPAGSLSTAELAAENVHGHRWWTPAELQAYDGPAYFSPRALPALLADLLTSGPPASPHLLGL